MYQQGPIYDGSGQYHHMGGGAGGGAGSVGGGGVGGGGGGGGTVELSTERRTLIPLVASDREKLVILNLGSGYIRMYGSSLPLFKNDFNTMLWTSPFLFFTLFLFGAYYFFANRKGVLTSGGSDDPFSTTSITKGASLVSGSGDRSFTDSSRNVDAMELRGFSERREYIREQSGSG
ncbi:hypothetical protein LIER_23829 [Lithospermum erythrorhizon]|uniref:Uncharacterized protein n=1 Tax=Lithospermum erythrorhizon TaxID=34254 RepID=A0AAV3R253_LITER